eukprot:m.243265 g.243265  ORF g.243265 m.243265 type:complete len:262 (-) comp19444_c0_seq1:161-946(-)
MTTNQRTEMQQLRTEDDTDKNEHFDVVIVGAGFSGIGAACYLKKMAPELTFVVVEMRANIGGTWDLFKYPGVRTDSDMWTYAYEFKPWLSSNQFASGDELMQYLNDVVSENNLRKHIRFSHSVQRANFSTKENEWEMQIVTKRHGKEHRRQLHSRFIIFGTGYFDYENGYTPDIAGIAEFNGKIIHPQHWTANDDDSIHGKDVTVIGSGATAITLIPELAKSAKHVIMLQRSPTYISGDRHRVLSHWAPTQWLMSYLPGFR